MEIYQLTPLTYLISFILFICFHPIHVLSPVENFLKFSKGERAAADELRQRESFHTLIILLESSSTNLPTYFLNYLLAYIFTYLLIYLLT